MNILKSVAIFPSFPDVSQHDSRSVETAATVVLQVRDWRVRIEIPKRRNERSAGPGERRQLRNGPNDYSLG